MARIKASCSKCGKTILLFFDPNDADYNEIVKLKAGEKFEHKCPSCNEWAAFEIPETEAPERDADLRGVTSPETHPEWPVFLKEIGWTAEQYAIQDEIGKKSTRDIFRRRIWLARTRATSLYEIVRLLADNDLLKPEPETIAIERIDHKVVYPCGRGGHPDTKLDLSQLEWANENKKLWFIPDITTLWIELADDVRPTNLDEIKASIRKIAEVAEFEVKFKRL